MVKEVKDEEMVTITRKEYDSLQRSERKLCALENGGVDNWSWYSEAMSEFYKEEEEEM